MLTKTNKTRRSQKLTTRETKSKQKIIRKRQICQGKSSKNFRKISHPEKSKLNDRLTDIQEILNYLDLVY